MTFYLSCPMATSRRSLLVDQILSPTGASALRQLLRELEPHARAAGHGATLDDWDLDFMRGPSVEPRH